MLRRLPFLLTTTLALATLPAAAASAAEPFTIGQGVKPHVLVDPATGTARAVWLDSDANRIRFCAVPRGATTCSHTATLAPPTGGPTTVGVPFLLEGGAGGIDKIVTVIGGKTYAYTSADGLTGWTPGSKIYDAGPGTNHRAPVLARYGEELLMPGTNPDLSVWAPRSNGTDAPVNTVAKLPTGGVSSLVYDLEVAYTGSTYVAAANNLQSTYLWAASPMDDPSTTPSWQGPELVGEGDTSRLAGGPTGAYLMTSAGTPSQPRIEVRRWAPDAEDIGGPATIASEQGYVNDIDVAPAGKVAAIWRKNDSPTHRLRLARSDDHGTTWTTATIAREAVVMADMDVAIADDGEGFAIYEGKSIDGDTREIRLASTAPLPEPPAPPAPGPGGSSTTVTTVPNPGTGGGKKPAPKTPKVKLTTATVPGATITLGVPSACIPAGKPFTATLSFAKQRKKGNLFVKVRRTDFSIGGKTLKKDTSAPFRQTLVIPNPKKGRTYTLKARAFIKVKQGRGPKKSVTATLKVCA